MLGAFPTHLHYPELVRRQTEQNKEGMCWPAAPAGVSTVRHRSLILSPPLLPVYTFKTANRKLHFPPK
ncbi:hypothetical protein NQZ68_006068 [Dissostichus eleginoides]|nr:hypothetical protein NQZ68_006068 [Dissostichus eleginoides]